MIARLTMCAVMVALALGACGDDDKPTYGGGFETLQECIDAQETLAPERSADEARAACTDEDDGGQDDEPDSELLTCPENLEVIAERRGGGFVEGTDPEYDPRMDWDGDGVSCE